MQTTLISLAHTIFLQARFCAFLVLSFSSLNPISSADSDALLLLHCYSLAFLVEYTGQFVLKECPHSHTRFLIATMESHWGHCWTGGMITLIMRILLETNHRKYVATIQENLTETVESRGRQPNVYSSSSIVEHLRPQAKRPFNSKKQLASSVEFRTRKPHWPETVESHHRQQKEYSSSGIIVHPHPQAERPFDSKVVSSNSDTCIRTHLLALIHIQCHTVYSTLASVYV